MTDKELYHIYLVTSNCTIFLGTSISSCADDSDNYDSKKGINHGDPAEDNVDGCLNGNSEDEYCIIFSSIMIRSMIIVVIIIIIIQMKIWRLGKALGDHDHHNQDHDQVKQWRTVTATGHRVKTKKPKRPKLPAWRGNPEVSFS